MDSDAADLSAMMIDRVEQIERDLASWAEKPIDFSFNPEGTPLFSMEEQLRSYPKRYCDLASAIRVLLAAEKIVPAAIVGRALIETVAMGCLFLHDMARLIESGASDRVEARLTRFFAGMKGAQAEPIHVMDAMRYLEKVDAAYVSFLDQKHGLQELVEKLRGSSGATDKRSIQEILSVLRNYDELSEIVHPNGLGTQFLYPDPVNEGPAVVQARLRFGHAAAIAIWQGHHLLAALNANTDLSQHYRLRFLYNKSP
jgi:hypothetical protein